VRLYLPNSESFVRILDGNFSGLLELSMICNGTGGDRLSCNSPRLVSSFRGPHLRLATPASRGNMPRTVTRFISKQETQTAPLFALLISAWLLAGSAALTASARLKAIPVLGDRPSRSDDHFQPGGL